MSKLASLKEKLAKLEASAHFDTLLPKTSGWLSRKLLVVLSVIGVLIFLGKDNIGAIIAGIIGLGMTYLIVQGAVDLADKFCDAWVRRKLIDAMAKDGLDSAEREVLGLPGEDPAKTTP